MKFSVPPNALVTVADGTQATFFHNTATSGIKLEKAEVSVDIGDGRGAAPTPVETSPHEASEAGFAKHLANALNDLVHKGGFDALVLIADPQTLGQIRPSLHQDVAKRITGELNKTLTNSSIADIEKILTTAINRDAN